jgi:aspartyl-tRNA(Asn)/glutamyl-tRNA(Gln) amidotransferase subunit A
MGADLPLTIAGAARQIAARKLDPVELTDALLERIAAIDPVVNAFITLTPALARAQAQRAREEIAAGRLRGPLHGIPLGIKDIYETAGIPTTGHSRAYASHVPAADAGAVEKLYTAGAVMLGKTATHELAHGGPSFDLPWPPARNPWHPAHFTGGSSSGSAAALAAGLVLGALGSDTGGSIRTPASLCGLAGIKPTFGLVGRHGVLPNSPSLDHCGPIARTMEDCAILLEAIAGYDPRDRSSVRGAPVQFRAGLRTDLKGLRIGVVRQFGQDDGLGSGELRGAMDAALGELERLGARLTDVRLRPLHDYLDVWTLIEEPETFALQRERLAARPGDFGAVFLERTLIAVLMQGADYVQAQQARSLLLDEMQNAFSGCDALVTAGAGPAPALSPALAAWPSPNRFVPFALSGRPAAVVCAGFSRAGLPLAMQIVGRPFEDATVLAIGHAYETATLWWQRRAPVEQFDPPAPLAYTPVAPPLSALDAQTVDLCIQASTRAGLHLPDALLALLCAQAPHVLAMNERVRACARAAPEPANVFAFSNPQR